jgi:hypothetical protein
MNKKTKKTLKAVEASVALHTLLASPEMREMMEAGRQTREQIIFNILKGQKAKA